MNIIDIMNIRIFFFNYEPYDHLKHYEQYEHF